MIITILSIIIIIIIIIITIIDIITARNALKLVRRMWPHRFARGLRVHAPGVGPVGLPSPGPGFGRGAGIEVPPVGARRG